MAMVPFLEMSLWAFVWGETHWHADAVRCCWIWGVFLFLLGSVGVFVLDLILFTADLFSRRWSLALFCVSSIVGTQYSKATHPLLG